jgi:hypothetical protein
VIGAEYGRKDHGSIPRNCDWERIKSLDARIDHQTRFNSVVKEKKKFYKQIR